MGVHPTYGVVPGADSGGGAYALDRHGSDCVGESRGGFHIETAAQSGYEGSRKGVASPGGIDYIDCVARDIGSIRPATPRSALNNDAIGTEIA